MPIVKKRPSLAEKPVPVASANSLLESRMIRTTAAAILTAAVKPMAAIVVTVVTVVTDTVVTISTMIIVVRSGFVNIS